MPRCHGDALAGAVQSSTELPEKEVGRRLGNTSPLSPQRAKRLSASSITVGYRLHGER